MDTVAVTRQTQRHRYLEDYITVKVFRNVKGEPFQTPISVIINVPDFFSASRTVIKGFIGCNDCDAVIRTVPASDLDATRNRMELRGLNGLMAPCFGDPPRSQKLQATAAWPFRCVDPRLPWAGRAHPISWNQMFTSTADVSSWSTEIATMWRFTRNNAITEGFHTKMEVLQRQAYGFRNFQNYRLRVRVMCS